jgi:hypothetical protein
MASTPITPILGEITEMQTAFRQPSCNSKLPFVEYPSVGTPPVLSFNVPQNTAFVTYGHLVKYLPPEYFKPFTKKVPENNYFDMVKNMTAQQANELFHPNVVVQSSPFTGKFTNVPITRPNQMLNNNFVAAAGSGASGLTSESAPTSETTPTTSSPTIPNPALYRIPPASMASPDSVIAQPLNIGKISLKADYAANNLRPYDVCRLNGQAPVTKYVSRPPLPVPRIIVIEEYTTTAYLGNYGAGRIVKTFSLYPGERTTISMRTYKDKVTTVESSKNVLDSFSEASATALDTLMQEEQGNIEATSNTSGGSGQSFTTSTDSRNSTKSGGISGGLNLGFLSIGGGYGKSVSEASTSSHGMSSAYDYSNTAVRQSNMNVLSSSLNKHVQQSNAVRQIDVNNTTSDTSRSGEETVTVRELQNVNLNNMLNLTMRQMLQEYTVITHLSNLKFAYTNGYPESYTVTDLCGLQNMLKDIIDETDPNNMNNVLCKLLSPYCKVLNYDDDFLQFVEKFELENADCLDLGCAPADDYIFRINKNCRDTYTDGVIDVTVKGVILNVQKQTLQTSSLIADALLGRGDALDCFNQNAQNAANMTAYTDALQGMQRLTDSIQTTANNQLFADQQLELGEKQIALAEKKVDAVTQQMDVVTGITDPLEKATHYKKVFGECCDVPQSCCGGGCGCTCADHEEPPTP